jgi:starch phosphorylase
MQSILLILKIFGMITFKKTISSFLAVHIITKEGVIAYFSMEIGLDPKIPTYAGGLGILAGDTLKSGADMGVPFVGVTLLSEKGFFHQVLNNGVQEEMPVEWHKQDFLKEMPGTVSVEIEGRTIYIKAWQYTLHGESNHQVPILYLDTNLPENSEWDREITSFLYGKDSWYRLCQEIVLGIGGIKILKMLGYTNIIKYHMNEGHAAFLALELLRELKEKNPTDDLNTQINFVRSKCVFTTHTPVPAGHDKFQLDWVQNAFRGKYPIESSEWIHEDKLNMTLLALRLSGHVNGVAKSHTEVSAKMFPQYRIESITNGVHSQTWTCNPIKKIFDQYIPGWRQDSYMLRYSLNISESDLWSSHEEQKKNLIDYVNRTNNANMDYETLTIGFARRATAYKRPELLFHNIERLKKLGHKKIQIIFAGKAHPSDTEGKKIIEKIHRTINTLKESVKIAYLSNYEMWLAQQLVSGVDLWLNTPIPPKEASGTSGMKAAHNGVLNLSILDGWWIEGHVEDVTGWSIGSRPQSERMNTDEEDANDLYTKLEEKIIPLFYTNRKKWVEMMLHGISHNASFFNTQRMVSQYVTNCYFS